MKGIDKSVIMWLHHNLKIGNKKIMNAVEKIIHDDNCENCILRAGSDRLEKRYGFTNLQSQILEDTNDIQKFKDDIEKFESDGIRIITYFDDEYPAYLLNIYDPPVVIYAKGNSKLLTRGCKVAVVGTRKPSEMGRRTAFKFSKELSDREICIVSGLAIGIDRYAHLGGLAGMGKSIGVVASGIDYRYPIQNCDIYESLGEEGLIISEFYPGTKPAGFNFVRRNRIISGISRGVLVVESGKKSGSLITANYCLEQGKSVMSVPGGITNSKAWGCNELIKNGAALIQTAEDILEEISFEKQLSIDFENPVYGISKFGIGERAECGNDDLPVLSEVHKKIIEILNINQPVGTSVISLITELDTSLVRDGLITLLQSGIVSTDKEGRYYMI